MYKNIMYVIPLFLIECIIQLSFFWLAPDCRCKWFVYGFITVLSIAHFVTIFALLWQYGLRKAAASVIVGSFVLTIIILSGALLLLFHAGVRSAVFALLILSALYMASISCFALLIDEDVTPDNTPLDPPVSEDTEEVETYEARRPARIHIQEPKGDHRINRVPPPLPSR